MESLELLDAITDSAVLLDKAGRIINWNTGATALFGYARKEVLGRSINLIYDRNYPFPKLIQEIHNNHQKNGMKIPLLFAKWYQGYCKSSLCGLPPNELKNKITALLVHPQYYRI